MNAKPMFAALVVRAADIVFGILAGSETLVPDPTPRVDRDGRPVRGNR